MIILFSFSNFINIFFGVLFGFLMCLFIVIMIISGKFKKKNKGPLVREISLKNYKENYKIKNKKTKDKILSSLVKEVEDVAKNEHPDSPFPLLELSLNEVLDTIDVLQKEMINIIDKPLLRSFKNKSLHSIKNSYNVIMKVYLPVANNSAVIISRKIYSYLRFVINFINPVFYIKLLLSNTIFRFGKKSIYLLLMDYVGNTTYSIYHKEEAKKENS